MDKHNKTVNIIMFIFLHFKGMNPSNKTIYMTYHSPLPRIVLKRWNELNPDYVIDFSMDVDCIKFLESEFHRNIAQLFVYIPRGMYKADLWRLCKLYTHGGVYADIDLVPFHSLIQNTATLSTTASVAAASAPVSFYSCLSMSKTGIFQAIMVHSRAKSPLILGFLVSFLVNKSYTIQDNGPTDDMYNFILYNVRATATSAGEINLPNSLQPYTHYTLRKIRIPIYVSSLDEHIIPIHYFPNDVRYTISINSFTRNKWVLANEDRIKMKIENHCVIIDIDPGAMMEVGARVDESEEGFIIDICIDLPKDQPEVIYLFKECIRQPPNISTCYVANCNGENIMDCRDCNYIRDRGWINQ